MEIIHNVGKISYSLPTINIYEGIKEMYVIKIP